MRIALAAATVAALSGMPLVAQDTTAVVCHAAVCLVTFEWGNAGAMPPDPDRRYGAPSDLESAFIARLQEASFQLTRTAPSATTLLVRIMPQNRALCDIAVGTDPDYSCHTAQRASITIQQSDTPKDGIRRVEVNPRCTDPKASPTFAQFGRYAGDYFVFMLGGQKGQRPTSIKC